ncbi:hypothetical protein B0T10DRAFT_481884 [Thelonectria olida]|uniref:Uncharacterized protein n=1 Tax=Thelonectria olida TaxID=1576542 RepID=A0A9P9APF5_9HYPO|nr:hypothetical protein B0T10DRAFT_481884 [Thelonectria olida]
MFARPFRPSHQTSSSPATESDSSAVTSDSDQGSPDHIPALPPAPRLYRPLRPLRPLAPAPPRMMDNSQQGPFSAPAFPVYPGSSFTAINAQPPRPAKRYFSPEQEDESPAKRRNIEQASQQVTQQPGQPAAHQVPPTIPRSQMAPWQQMDFRGLPLSYGRDSQYRVEHQPNAREGQPLIEPRAQVPGNPGWIGQHSPTQAYHYQPLAYYSHGRGRSGAPLPQGPYSQDNYRQNGSDASEQYPGPLPNPNGHNGRQC